MRAVLDAWREVGLRKLIEVEAGAECGSRPGQYDRTDGRILAQLSSWSVISLRSLIESALRRSGRASVSVATPSSATSVAMSRLIAPPNSDVDPAI